ncbi:ankyrin repeat-containing protein At5g02620-like [Magnolia sinica]|uniref:ankyrin repeat-containing protein At5g02620-like n=1 Tax=Magnolia sinica TaxID=86752 RepID=UPI00265823A5|nr:ankyrin repeat-containing protein At5g02620-like [Magnolia sinica]
MDPHLHQAARLGSVPLLNAITTDSDQQILYSSTPEILNNALHIAARLGHAVFTKEILGRCGARLMQANSTGDTPLHCATRTGRLNVVEILLNWIVMEERNMELLRMTNKEKNTALHEALRNRHENVAVKLLESDLGLAYLVNEAGESPLHMAAREELLQVVEKILDIKPSDEKTNMVRIRDAHGRTALHYAACQDNSTIVEKLLKVDHSLAYILDNIGYSSLHVATASGSPKAIAELLKQCPDASEQLDPNGKNVFHIAIMYNKNSTFRRLLRMEVLEGMINEPDTDGNTLLHFAFKYHNDPMFLLLSKEGRVDPTIVNKDGQTALDFIELDAEYAEYFRWLNRSRYQGTICGQRRKMPSGICKTRPEYMAARSDRYKSRVDVHTLVAALIASVTFAATFTMPGGYKNDGPNKGSAVLVNHAAFKAFLLSNTIALCCSLLAVVGFLWMWSQQKMFLPLVLLWVHNFTVYASLAMIVSFVSAVYAVVAPECMWLAIVTLAIGVAMPFYIQILLFRLEVNFHRAFIGYKRSAAHNQKPV